MRTVVGKADNSCLTFGSPFDNTDCYEYTWLPDREAPVGPIGCTKSGFTPTAVSWYNNEKGNVECKFFTELNCKGGEVDRLPGCTDLLWGKPFEQIHSFRCVS